MTFSALNGVCGGEGEHLMDQWLALLIPPPRLHELDAKTQPQPISRGVACARDRISM
jgi:hypothetical protein